MNGSRFKWKLTALLVGLLVFVPGVGAKRTNSNAAPSGKADLGSETRTVTSFTDDLSAFDKRRAQLSKRSSLTREEFNALEQTGNDLKRRVAQLRDATTSIINKLKASGQWNTLDEDVLSGLTNPKDRAILRDRGGLRRLFEQAAADLSSQNGDEIVAPLSQLRQKVARRDRFDLDQEVAFRMVEAAYRPSIYNAEAPLFLRSLRCLGATIRLGVSIVIHGPSENKPANQDDIPPDTRQAFQCHCEDFNCPGAAVE